MNNSFCPFINGQCREDCVFRLQRKVETENGTAICQLAISSTACETLCDILIKEKEEN